MLVSLYFRTFDRSLRHAMRRQLSSSSKHKFSFTIFLMFFFSILKMVINVWGVITPLNRLVVLLTFIKIHHHKNTAYCIHCNKCFIPDHYIKYSRHISSAFILEFTQNRHYQVYQTIIRSISTCAVLIN